MRLTLILIAIPKRNTRIKILATTDVGLHRLVKYIWEGFMEWVLLIIAFLGGAWLERRSIQTYGEYWKHGLEEDPVDDGTTIDDVTFEKIAYEYWKIRAINQGTIWKSRNILSGLSEEEREEVNKRLDKLKLNDYSSRKERMKIIEKVKQEVQKEYKKKTLQVCNQEEIL